MQAEVDFGFCEMDTDSLNTIDPSAVSRATAASEEKKSSIADRQFQRVRTLLTGVLILDDALVDVMVLDISANGARIRAKEAVPDVSEFKIRVNGVGQFQGVVRWREGNTFGVQFLEEPQEVARNLGGRLKNILAK